MRIDRGILRVATGTYVGSVKEHTGEVNVAGNHQDWLGSTWV